MTVEGSSFTNGHYDSNRETSRKRVTRGSRGDLVKGRKGGDGRGGLVKSRHYIGYLMKDGHRGDGLTEGRCRGVVGRELVNTGVEGTVRTTSGQQSPDLRGTRTVGSTPNWNFLVSCLDVWTRVGGS